MNVQRFITTISLSLGLVAGSGVVSAQETINADGNAVTSRAGSNPVADAGGPTIVYGDLDPGSGVNVIGPPTEAPAPGTTENVTAGSGDAAAIGPGNASAAPGTVTSDGSSGTSLLGPDGAYSVSEVTPSNVTVGDQGTLAPVPAAAPAPVTETAPVETAPADTAVATATDLDADNYPDALEWDLGLDGNNPDTDGDGVADGDELNIYGAQPTVFDTDGDGLSDGQELFASGTDPLVWDTDGDGVGDGESALS